MKVFIDGEPINCFNDVKIVYDNVHIYSGYECQLEILINKEELAFDLYDEPYDEYLVHSQTHTPQEITEYLLD